MPRGGARPRSGRVPDMQALNRQRDGKEWTRLPAAGRLAPAPEWPLAVLEPNDNEMLKWREMWTMPQALVWEADRTHDLVAFYVRTYLESMQPRTGAQARTFVKQLSDELLLTPNSLQRARYVIAGTDEDAALAAAQADHSTERTPARGRARDRFTVVEGGEPEVDLDEDEEADGIAGARPETDSGEPPF